MCHIMLIVQFLNISWSEEESNRTIDTPIGAPI